MRDWVVCRRHRFVVLRHPGRLNSSLAVAAIFDQFGEGQSRGPEGGWSRRPVAINHV
jgi:hypothetical protein